MLSTLVYGGKLTIAAYDEVKHRSLLLAAKNIRNKRLLGEILFPATGRYTANGLAIADVSCRKRKRSRGGGGRACAVSESLLVSGATDGRH